MSFRFCRDENEPVLSLAPVKEENTYPLTLTLSHQGRGNVGTRRRGGEGTKKIGKKLPL